MSPVFGTVPSKPRRLVEEHPSLIPLRSSACIVPMCSLFASSLATASSSTRGDGQTGRCGDEVTDKPVVSTGAKI